MSDIDWEKEFETYQPRRRERMNNYWENEFEEYRPRRQERINKKDKKKLENKYAYLGGEKFHFD